jgi:hypothetical protein
MKELIKELEESIYDCKLDTGDGGDNLDLVNEAIELLEKLKEAINYTRCCETLSSDIEIGKAVSELSHIADKEAER